MRGPMSLEEFAALARAPVEDIARYRDAGLLDPDGDGLFDEYDALRLQYVLTRLDAGRSIEELAALARGGKADMPFFADLLYQRDEGLVPMSESAEHIGLTPEQVRALGTAIGIPIRRAFDPADLRGLAGVKAMIDAGMPLPALLEASRVLGDAMRRFTQTEAQLMHEHVHEPLRAQGASETEIMRVTEAVMAGMAPVLDQMLVFVHRQYLLRAVIAEVVHHFGGHQTAEATIVFVDLSSFTALASVHGDEAAAEVLDRFDALVRTLVQSHAGSLVKQIGDAFMLTFADAADGVRFALALSESATQEDRFPALRVGVHAGPVLYRVGDYVGTTVNLASRILGAAGAGEIVLSEPVALAAGAAGIPVEPVGVRMFRGADEPVSLFRVVRARDRRDPVCGMTVATAAIRLTSGGVEHAFCSDDCLRRFVEAPDRYAVTGGKA